MQVEKLAIPEVLLLTPPRFGDARGEVICKVAAEYDRAAERGAIWNGPTLALPWPVDPTGAVLSDKDRALPKLADCDAWFRA